MGLWCCCGCVPSENLAGNGLLGQDVDDVGDVSNDWQPPIPQSRVGSNVAFVEESDGDHHCLPFGG